MKKQLYDKENAGAPSFADKSLPESGIGAKRSLIEENLIIAFFVAKKYSRRADELEDLIAVGNVGLVKAAYTFNSLRKTQFSTYASRCVENEILMYLRRNMKREVLMGDWKTESLPEQGEDPVWREMEHSINIASIEETADRLPPKQKKIIYLRFGLDGKRERTQKEVARLVGVSQSNVSKVEQKFGFLLKDDLADDAK